MELHLWVIRSDYLGNEMYLKQLCRTVRHTLLEKCQNIVQLYTIIAVCMDQKIQHSEKKK